MFNAQQPALMLVEDEKSVSQLGEYLRSSQRVRILMVIRCPQALPVQPFDLRMFVDDYKIDVAVIENDNHAGALSFALPAEHKLEKAGDLRIFPRDGSVTDPAMRSWFVYYNSGNPKNYSKFAKYATRMLTEREKQASAAQAQAAPARPSAVSTGACSGKGASASAPAGVAGDALAVGKAEAAVVASAATAAGATGAAMATSAAVTAVATPSASAGAGSARMAAPPANLDAPLSSSQVNLVDNAAKLNALVCFIKDDGRKLPVVVVTRPNDGKAALVDASDMARRLEDVAYVAEVTTPALTWRMSLQMPQGAVYNGAMRLFMPIMGFGGDYCTERHLYRLFNANEAQMAAREVVAEVMGSHAWAAKHSSSEEPEAHADDTIETDVKVRGVITSANCALCATEDGTFCSMYPAEVATAFGLKKLDASKVFADGMTLHGKLNMHTKRFTDYASGNIMSKEQALEGYKAGDTILVRVASTSGGYCEVDLYPGVRARIEAADVVGETTRPIDVLSISQTVQAKIIERGVGGEGWLLSILEADDESVQAPPLLKGGAPWLSPDEAKQVEAVEETLERDYGEDAAIYASDAVIPQDAGPDATMAIRGLSAQLYASEQSLAQARGELERVKSQLEKAKRDLLASGRRNRDPLKRYRAPSYDFANLGDKQAFESNRMDLWLREEWLSQTTPADRKDDPLPTHWGYESGFFDTFENVDVAPNKVLRCMVDILTGHPERRETHHLRTGAGGSDPARKGSAGETMYRCAVEKNVPQAARLHYMIADGGEITFLSVRRHDDFRS